MIKEVDQFWGKKSSGNQNQQIKQDILNKINNDKNQKNNRATIGQKEQPRTANKKKQGDKKKETQTTAKQSMKKQCFGQLKTIQHIENNKINKAKAKSNSKNKKIDVGSDGNG